MQRIPWTIAQRDALESKIARRIRFECPPQDDLARPVEGPCWTWTAGGSRGYGAVAGLSGRSERAHRVMMAICSIPIPDGYDIDHLCRNKRCVNPDHLEAVSHGENLRRGLRKLHRNGVCARCGGELTYQKANAQGHRSARCKPCLAIRRNERYAADPGYRESIRAYQRNLRATRA